MIKLKLSPEDLRVESFATHDPDAKSSGSVHARSAISDGPCESGEVSCNWETCYPYCTQTDVGCCGTYDGVRGECTADCPEATQEANPCTYDGGGGMCQSYVC
ncbi:MAG: hypothetical protein ACJ8GN_11830 [Longimicrobiaceae bacterium]